MQINQIAFNGDVYCAVGDNAYCAISPDQINWIDQHENFKKVFIIGADGQGIAWNGKVFCAVGGGPLPYGAFACCGTSTDGINWESQNLCFDMWEVAKSIEWDGNSFIVSSFHDNKIVSKDGKTWSPFIK